MTVDNKKIEKFLFNIQFNKSFLLEANEWENKFLFNICESHGITKKELALFIYDYRQSNSKKITKRKITGRVLDTKTGIIYKNVLDYSKKTGISKNKAYANVQQNTKRFKLLEVNE